MPEDLVSQVRPIVEMDDLIEERTGARPGQSGMVFRLNPRVDDIPERFSVEHRGIKLLQMGTVRGAGAGCVCPENTMLKMLMLHLLLREKETVILDMVAGLEHMGRGTATAVDAMYIIVEPGIRSTHTAHRIAELAAGLNITKLWVVANKVRSQREEAFIREQLPGFTIAGVLPYSENAIEADMTGEALFDVAPDMAGLVRGIVDATLS